MKILPEWIRSIENIGIRKELDTYEKGLIRLTNKSTITILIIINLIYFPVAISNKATIPLLVITSLFYPVTIFLNYFGKYILSRHYLIMLLDILLLVISIFRGVESGVLFVSIPILVLSFIFFYKSNGIYIHLFLTVAIIVFILIYTNSYPPLQPHLDNLLTVVYTVHLTISLSLTAFFINFLFEVNREYQRELIDLNNTKNTLFSIIGHDLKSPLNSLKGILNLLNNKSLSKEDFYELSGHLEKSTELLHNTLENLLQWSVTQMKGFTIRPAIVNLHAIVKEHKDLYDEIAKRKKIVIENQVPEQIEVVVDINHVKLVLRNLINNAIKFTHENGKIIIQAEQKNQEVEITVADSGIGILQNELQNILMFNTKISKKGTQGESGTGLGLLLCKEVIEKNKGKLWAVSEIEKGSKFIFTLPAT